MSHSQKKKQSRLKLSSWNLPEEAVNYYKKNGVENMFPWQVACLLTGQALQGGNLLYSAPTSAGKSLVAEILALKRVLRTKRKAIFILPFVSVAREKMFSLRAMYSGLGLTVGGFMGAQTPPGGFKKVDVAVCTIERANSLLNRLLESGKLSQLAVIVVDELHMVGDPSRGCLLEPLLTKVNFHLSNTPVDPDVDSSVQIIGMSATLPNMHVLSKWLSAALYVTDFRPVPLTEYVKIGSSILNDKLEFVRDIEVPGIYNNDNELVVNLCLETIKQGKSVLIFCPSKIWCEKLATLLAKSFYQIMFKKVDTSDILSGPLNAAINKEKITEMIEELKRSPAGVAEPIRLCMSYATAYHHAGLTMEEKDIIESGFRKTIIRVLVSTTTLSSGVNLPAQRVIIRSPMFMSKTIDALTYKQMVGRAGRKGIDSFGESILICKPTEKKNVQALLTSDLPAATSQLCRRDADGNYILRASVRRALLEVIASGTAKTVEMVNKYIRCTLLAAELEGNQAADVSGLVEQCLSSLLSDEFILRTPADDAGELLTPTQLGSAVFASSMNPDDSLTILCDLNKARKQFVLENELHMVYQVTPINTHVTIDWMRYLSLWESLSSDLQRVGELVGVSERFITLSHQGRRIRNTDSQQRSLDIHKRFYMALVLHDLVNEMPLIDAEKKYDINKGQLQSLQQNAAIFAGMICTFCNRLGFTPLKLLLSDFQQRLDLGVRRELVDLIRVTSLDAKKARHFYDSGIHTVAELVNAGTDQVCALLQTFLPFESAKQGHGESEWELRERSARRVYISGRKSLSITEAAQLVIDEAKQVFEFDLNQLGINASLMHNRSMNRSSSFSTPVVTPIKPPTITPQAVYSGLPTTSRDAIAMSSNGGNRNNQGFETSNQSEAPAKETMNLVVNGHTTLYNDKSDLTVGAKVNSSNSQSTTPSSKSSISQLSKSNLFSFTKVKELAPPKSDHNILITDSQESTTSSSSNVAKYKQLLDKIELCTSNAGETSKHDVPPSTGTHANVSINENQSNEPMIKLDKATDDTPQIINRPEPKPEQAVDNYNPQNDALTADSSIAWDDSFLVLSQSNQPQPLSKAVSTDAKLSVGTPQRPVNDQMTLPSASTRSSDLLQAIIDNPSPAHTDARKSCKRLSDASPDLTYTRLKKARRIRTSTVDTPRIRSRSFQPSQSQSNGGDEQTGVDSPCFRESPIPVSVDPSSSRTPQADRLSAPVDRRQSVGSAWSPLNDSSLLLSTEKPAIAKVVQQTAIQITPLRNFTAESNDLFSKSMDSSIWSPLPDLNTSPSNARATTSDNQPCQGQHVSSKLSDSNHQSFITDMPLQTILSNLPQTTLEDKITIVDVCADPVLYKTFLTEWTEARVYSLSLACAPVAQYEKVESQDSIGYHSSGDTTNNTKDDTGLSTSTILIPEGTVLHQYNVMVRGLAVCMDFKSVFYIDLTEPPKHNKESSTVEQRLQDIRNVLENRSSVKVIFDSKEHVKRLASLLRRELDMCSGIIDPKLAVWMLDPAEKEHNLIGVVHKLIPKLSNIVTSNIGVCKGNGSVALNPHPGTSARLRACYESFSMLAMSSRLLTDLQNKGLYESFNNVEMPHLACLARMETDGFGFDHAEFQNQSRKILDCLNVIEKESSKYAKRCFDLGSPKDVGEVLFVQLRLPYERKKVTGKRAPWSTAQAQLEKIKSHHPLPGLILLWRKLHSALKTLIQPLDMSKVWCEERRMYRIYATCSIHTATGRITMHEPNLQTIRKDISLELEGFPELADKSVSLRNIFTAPPGYQLISADYSQLELRIISHLASDSTLLELLNGGGDVFKDIASRWKSVPVSEVTDEQRQHAKQICYGIIYGMGSKALSEQLLVPEDTAEQLMSDFQSTFTGLKRYIFTVVEQCQALGYVSTIAGRRRYLPNITSTSNKAGRAQAERQAVNTTVQGSAADLVKLATINIQQLLPPDVRLVLQIHDELIYEMPTHSLSDTARLIKRTMESVTEDLGLTVNMVVRVKSGTTWAQLSDMEL